MLHNRTNNITLTGHHNPPITASSLPLANQTSPTHPHHNSSRPYPKSTHPNSTHPKSTHPHSHHRNPTPKPIDIHFPSIFNNFTISTLANSNTGNNGSSIINGNNNSNGNNVSNGSNGKKRRRESQEELSETEEQELEKTKDKEEKEEDKEEKEEDKEEKEEEKEEKEEKEKEKEEKEEEKDTSFLARKFKGIDPTEDPNLFQVLAVRKNLRKIRPDTAKPSQLLGCQLGSTEPLTFGEYAFLYVIFMRKKRCRK